jgi:serine/threonine protein kinase
MSSSKKKIELSNKIMREMKRKSKIFSKCTILKKIGEGGYGVVYICQPYSAIKIQTIVDNDRLRKLEREVKIQKILNKCSSKYIVRIFESEIVMNVLGDSYFIMRMTYDENYKNLYNYIRDSNNFLNLSEIINIAENLLLGLKCIHDLGIVYYDLKPGNILLHKNHKNIKYLDFGLAQQIQNNLNIKKRLKRSGTPNYTSPEILNKIPIEKREHFKTDIWSLGVTLYFLDHNQLPFRGNTKDETYSKIKNFNPYTGNRFPMDKLDRLIKKLLTKDYRQRPNIDQALAYFYKYVKKEKGYASRSSIKKRLNRKAIRV